MYGYKELLLGTGISVLRSILKVLVNVVKPIKPITVLRSVSEVRI